jgi:hypothetical protein
LSARVNQALKTINAARRIPIYTFVTDEEKYAAMRNAFEEAGFGPDHATFIRLENRGRQSDPEPYSTITKLIETVSEPLFILCHQDVRPDCGHRLPDLERAITELDRLDGKWAVAGNAGGSQALRMVRRLTDPHGESTEAHLPRRVQSLDENLLVIKARTGISCSPGLRGFHYYGSDLCLNARAAGYRSYVIDFHLRHLSGGKKDASYDEARDRFVEYWSPRFHARYLRSPMEVLFLGRNGLRRTLGAPTVRRVLKNHRRLGRVAGLVFARD